MNAPSAATHYGFKPGPRRTAECQTPGCDEQIVWFYRRASPTPPRHCCECKANAFRDRGIRAHRKH